MYRFFLYKDMEICFTEDKLNFSEHCHTSSYIASFILKGSAVLKKINKSSILNSGDFFTVKPYENHSLYSEYPVSMISICIKNQSRYAEPSNIYELSRNRIERNPEEIICIDELCKEIYVSKYYYIRKFKEVSGLAPHKFQIQCRIRKAQRLLLNGENIVKVSADSGFYDQSHFDKYFRKIVGLSPTEYIKSVSNFLQAEI